ncbi:MAG: hypothetical protein M0Z28_14640 [Rhodospirillales bacterium]|nr:hypothetical protein [Rhodospirillales bacterium]
MCGLTAPVDSPLLGYAVDIRRRLPAAESRVPLVPGGARPAWLAQEDLRAAEWGLAAGIDLTGAGPDLVAVLSSLVSTADVEARKRLIAHRLVARSLTTEPELLNRAVELLNEWAAEEGSESRHRAEWRRVLAQGADEVRRRIVRRDAETLAWLTKSPLGVDSGLFADDAVRRQVHRKARQGLVLRALPPLVALH